MKKEKEMIGFRYDGWPLAEPFLQAVVDLETSQSEFARRCIEFGFERAKREMEKERDARKRRLHAAMKALTQAAWASHLSPAMVPA